MKKMNFYIQLVMAILALISAFLGYNGLMLIMMIQLVIGVYQLLSASVVTVGLYRRQQKSKLLTAYWIIVGAYLAGLIWLVLIEENEFDTVLLSYILAAWPIAIYYLFISYKRMKTFISKRDGFLPNLDSYFQK